jgi:hypothetical protein
MLLSKAARQKTDSRQQTVDSRQQTAESRQKSPSVPLLKGWMTGGASRKGAQSCPVSSLPGRPAKRIKAAKGDFLGRKRGFDTGRGGIRKKAGDAPAFQYTKEGSMFEERGAWKKEGEQDEDAVF